MDDPARGRPDRGCGVRRVGLVGRARHPGQRPQAPATSRRRDRHHAGAPDEARAHALHDGAPPPHVTLDATTKAHLRRHRWVDDRPRRRRVEGRAGSGRPQDDGAGAALDRAGNPAEADPAADHASRAHDDIEDEHDHGAAAHPDDDRRVRVTLMAATDLSALTRSRAGRAALVAVSAGVSGLLAGRVASRVWWPIHKLAAAALGLAFLHGILGGGDTAALTAMYAVTAVLVVGVGAHRYLARTPAESIAQPIR